MWKHLLNHLGVTEELNRAQKHPNMVLYGIFLNHIVSTSVGLDAEPSTIPNKTESKTEEATSARHVVAPNMLHTARPQPCSRPPSAYAAR